MDLQERYQLEMAARMQKVRKRAKPWRSIIALLLAIAGAITAGIWGKVGRVYVIDVPGHQTEKIIFVIGVAAFAAFGLVATVGLSGQARSSLQPLIGQAHAGVVRYVLLLAGMFTVLLVTLNLVQAPVGQLLVGGAVAGVLLGIAAQQSLANLFAGLVLLFARPFRVGDRVRLRAGALAGTIEGIVIDISLTYVRLQTEEGPALVPNSQALAASVQLMPNGTDGPDETGAATTD